MRSNPTESPPLEINGLSSTSAHYTAGAPTDDTTLVYVVIQVRLEVGQRNPSPGVLVNSSTTISVQGVFKSEQSAEAETTRLNALGSPTDRRYFWQCCRVTNDGDAPELSRPDYVDIPLRVQPPRAEPPPSWAWMRGDARRVKMSVGLFIRVQLLRVAGTFRRAVDACSKHLSRYSAGRDPQKWFAKWAAEIPPALGRAASFSRDSIVRLGGAAWRSARAFYRWLRRFSTDRQGRLSPPGPALMTSVVVDGMRKSRAWMREKGSRVKARTSALVGNTAGLFNRKSSKESKREPTLVSSLTPAPVRDQTSSWLIAQSELRRLSQSWFTRISITLVASAIRRHAKACGYEVQVEWFGAYDQDPRNLVFWLRTETEEEKRQVERDEEFWSKARSFLVRYRYPQAGRKGVFFGVESREAAAGRPGRDRLT